MSETITKEVQPTTEPTPGATGGQGGEKTFTQEEVNRIVSERLKTERDKLTAQPKETEEEKAMKARESDLKARESCLDCREYLESKKLPGELLDILDTSDVEKFKEAAEKLAALLPETGGKVPIAVAGTSGRGFGMGDRISEAFKPKI